jgi:tetratricopeptide (TPR) repeat protein
MLTKSEFDQLQQRIFQAWHRGEISEAFAEIDSALREGTSDMKGQSLFYRGMINESIGSLDAAMQDWLSVLKHAERGSFLRYQAEYGIGTVCQKSGRDEDGLSWYRKALNTCLDGGAFSGHQALAAFFSLNGGQPSSGIDPLVTAVLKKSWHVLELPGSAPSEDLGNAIDALCEQFSQKVEEARKTE